MPKIKTPNTLLTAIRLTKRGFLKYGDQGDDVRLMQKALAAVGFVLTGTGFYGTATELAVETLQERVGVTKDGEFGEETAGILDTMLEAARITVADLEKIAEGPAPVAPVTSGIVDPIWVTAALKMLGTTEKPGAGDNPEILAWAKDEGGMIAEEYRHDSTAWCALAANHILTLAGLKGTETLWALDFHSDTKWPNVRLAGPARGAFAPMKRTGGGHIAVVMGRDQHGNLMLWGGNVSDSTNIKPFPKDRPLSFRWPKATGVALPDTSIVGFSHLPVIKSDGRVSTREA